MLCVGDERTAREGARSRRGGPFAAPTDGVSILIVDDDANFCTAVGRALASTPFLPFSVGGGGEVTVPEVGRYRDLVLPNRRKRQGARGPSRTARGSTERAAKVVNRPAEARAVENDFTGRTGSRR